VGESLNITVCSEEPAASSAINLRELFTVNAPLPSEPVSVEIEMMGALDDVTVEEMGHLEIASI
jgi:hypothetical protein